MGRNGLLLPEHDEISKIYIQLGDLIAVLGPDQMRYTYTVIVDGSLISSLHLF